MPLGPSAFLTVRCVFVDSVPTLKDRFKARAASITNAVRGIHANWIVRVLTAGIFCTHAVEHDLSVLGAHRFDQSVTFRVRVRLQFTNGAQDAPPTAR